MALAEELEQVAALAAAEARGDERLAAVLPAEPLRGRRVYLCAFENAAGARTWLALDADGRALEEREAVRDAVSIVATCELAAESAGGGDLEELQQQLVTLRVTERPEGIEEAEEAVLALQRVIAAPPQLATPARLDAIGAAARELELSLGAGLQPSPFAEAMRAGRDVVDALLADVEAAYRRELR
jgi:hypothetical protein